MKKTIVAILAVAMMLIATGCNAHEASVKFQKALGMTEVCTEYHVDDNGGKVIDKVTVYNPS